MREKWVHKYNPVSAVDYIYPRGEAGKILSGLLNKDFPPHLILHGPPGTGKSSYVGVLANNYNIDPVDIVRFMGSDISCGSAIKDMIYPVITTMPFNSQFKILHIEEADHMNKRAITDMKSILEDYEGVVVVMTTNNISTIDSALLSRCIVVEVVQSEKNMVKLAEKILAAESCDYNSDQLANMLRAIPPDLRSVINALQFNFYS